MKMKVGRNDLGEDLERVAAMLDADEIDAAASELVAAARILLDEGAEAGLRA